MRRKSPRVVWLPQTNANSLGGLTVYQGDTLSSGPLTGNTAFSEIPLVLDAAQSPVFTIDSSLADLNNSGYRLRRIVGKIWVICGQSDPGAFVDSPVNGICTVGIMVRKADTATGASLGALADPVGNANSPALIENTSDPWVWRRSWFLGNEYAFDNVLSQGAEGVVTRDPQAATNFLNYAGGNADGPHVDQKTARIVGLEERLFLTWSVTTVTQSANAGGQLNWALFTDLRVLGSLKTNVGNRRNASR